MLQYAVCGLTICLHIGNSVELSAKTEYNKHGEEKWWAKGRILINTAGVLCGNAGGGIPSGRFVWVTFRGIFIVPRGAPKSLKKKGIISHHDSRNQTRDTSHPGRQLGRYGIFRRGA